jgi:hypothetical protein
MGPSGVEAVGAGTVSASFSAPDFSNCSVELLLNGSLRNSVEVIDGDSVSVELYVSGECTCCETQRQCNAMSGSTPLWVQKSGRENKVIELNRGALAERIKMIAENVKKKSKKLRGR